MELKLQNGDYVLDGAARLCRVEGAEALLQRVLFRLSARRGRFPSGERWEASSGNWGGFRRRPAAGRQTVCGGGAGRGTGTHCDGCCSD